MCYLRSAGCVAARWRSSPAPMSATSSASVRPTSGDPLLMSSNATRSDWRRSVTVISCISLNFSELQCIYNICAGVDGRLQAVLLRQGGEGDGRVRGYLGQAAAQETTQLQVIQMVPTLLTLLY